MRNGQMVLAAGTEITPGVIGVLATVKCAQLPVYRRPRVAILATGDELEALDAPFDPNRIPNSNSYALMAQTQALGIEPELLGIARDDPQELARFLECGLAFDVLLVSGGSSVGVHDHVRPTLEALGDRLGSPVETTASIASAKAPRPAAAPVARANSFAPLEEPMDSGGPFEQNKPRPDGFELRTNGVNGPRASVMTPGRRALADAADADVPTSARIEMLASSLDRIERSQIATLGALAGPARAHIDDHADTRDDGDDADDGGGAHLGARL